MRNTKAGAGVSIFCGTEGGLGLKDFFVKGKEYANEAAYYLSDKDKKIRKGIKQTADYLEPGAEKLTKLLKKSASATGRALVAAPDKINQGIIKTGRFTNKFKQNLSKELAPARRFSEGAQSELLFQVTPNRIIKITSMRKDRTVVRNEFANAVEAVSFIKKAKKVGHKIVKIEKK